MKPGKVLLYFEPAYEDNSQASHEDRLKNKDLVGFAYTVDEITGNEWGDDWNDAPAFCNSGTPYPETCKGLEIVEMRLGETLPNAGGSGLAKPYAVQPDERSKG